MSENNFHWSVSEHDFIWNRTLLMEDEDKIEIIDSFQAKRIDGYLYFSEDIRIEDVSKEVIKIGMGKRSKYLISLKNIDIFEISDAEYFTSYGKRSHTKKLSWTKETNHNEETTLLEIDRIKDE